MQCARVIRAIVVLLTIAAVAGCKTVEKRPDEAKHSTDTLGHADSFQLKLPPGSTLDTLMAADLDGRGKPEYIVASRDTSALPAGARATRVELFAFDSAAHSYTRAFTHELAFGTRFELRDVTGDGHPDLVIFTSGGGNDVVASSGMIVGSWQKDSVTIVYNSDHGDPALQAVPGVRGESILAHEEFWPARGSHADAVEYVSDILALRNGTFASIRTEQSRMFADYAAGYLAAYRKARQAHASDTLRQDTDSLRAADSLRAESELEQNPLFTQAALAMTMLERAGQPRELRTFWSAERDYIRKRVAGSDFQQLELLYTDAVRNR